jgi:hypothetical protein
MLMLLAYPAGKTLLMQEALNGRAFEGLGPLDKAIDDLSWWHNHLDAQKT